MIFRYTLSKALKYSFTCKHKHLNVTQCCLKIERFIEIPFRCISVSSANQRRNRSMKSDGISRKKNEDFDDISGVSNRRNTLNMKSASPVVFPYDPTLEVKPQEGDKLFSKIVMEQKIRKHREKTNVILLKGTELIKVALASGCLPQKYFYSKEEVLKSLPSLQVSPENIIQVRDRTLRDLLGRETSPGIVGIFSKPTVKEISSEISVTVLCTDIREPSNLGLIIVSAAATGCKKVLLCKGCADPWEHKVLSVAEGAHFHVPIINNIDFTSLSDFISKEAAFYIADNSADIDFDESNIYTDVDYCSPSENSEVTNINYLDSNEAISAQKHKLQGKELQEQVHMDMPCHIFSSVAFPKKDIVICVGGESQGIDSRIEQLGSQFNAQKLKIPLENDMDSLNVASALSVILFEIQRQFSKKKHAEKSG